MIGFVIVGEYFHQALCGGNEEGYCQSIRSILVHTNSILSQKSECKSIADHSIFQQFFCSFVCRVNPDVSTCRLKIEMF